MKKARNNVTAEVYSAPASGTLNNSAFLSPHAVRTNKYRRKSKNYQMYRKDQN